MSMFQRTVALTANQNSRDILSQILGYPYVASRPMGLNIAFNSELAGVLFSVQVGAAGGELVTFVDDMQPLVKQAFGINPDDFVMGLVPILAGQQLLIPVRETAAGTPEIFITIIPQFA